MHTATTCLVLLCTLSICLANTFAYHLLSTKLHKIQKEKEAAGITYPAEQYFTEQLVDHFNGLDRRTWSQRFFINDTFFNKDLGGPIFFQFGGEGAISAGYVVDLMMDYYGANEGALLVALEHRFYGKSQPLTDLSLPNLAYLSSEQALADAAYFINTYLRVKYPKAKDVISFGGSYPGNLAAWFRIKYPHITTGAVASSAPVQAELDMVQYLDVVDESLAKIAGVICDQNIQAATQTVEQLTTFISGRAYLSLKFQLCEPLQTDDDISTFMSNLMGNWMGVVQYNGESPSSPTIKDLCGIMENETIPDVFTRYLTVANLFTQGCMDISYTNMIEQLKNVSVSDSGVGIRQWTYQTCAEFGYFQTTDSKNQPFGSLVPLSYYTKICQDAFGITTWPFINETNSEYGGNNPVGSNILFVNGNIDPWHALSVTKNISDTIQAIYIDGTAHCANMFPAKPTDPPGLAVAQQQTAAIIHQWLTQKL